MVGLNKDSKLGIYIQEIHDNGIAARYVAKSCAMAHMASSSTTGTTNRDLMEPNYRYMASHILPHSLSPLTAPNYLCHNGRTTEIKMPIDLGRACATSVTHKIQMF